MKSGISNYHKVGIYDLLHVPKFWYTWPMWANTKKGCVCWHTLYLVIFITVFPKLILIWIVWTVANSDCQYIFKNKFSREILKPHFLVTFNFIISHISPIFPLLWCLPDFNHLLRISSESFFQLEHPRHQFTLSSLIFFFLKRYYCITGISAKW